MATFGVFTSYLMVLRRKNNEGRYDYLVWPRKTTIALRGAVVSRPAEVPAPSMLTACISSENPLFT